MGGFEPDLIISDKELLADAMAVEFLVPAVILLLDNQNAQIGSTICGHNVVAECGLDPAVLLSSVLWGLVRRP